jgi:AcrR family transcriptional regulator
MISKKEKKSEETKKKIVKAAGKLFSLNGYQQVTMRQIAKEADCSHTAIYIYFKDKESLLHYLSMPALEDLKQELLRIKKTDQNPELKIKEESKAFIQFCFENQSMFPIFLGAESQRVDEKDPKSELNKTRIELFHIFMTTLQECFINIENEATLLAFSRIFFYTLHGIAATYSTSSETAEELMERLHTTFDSVVDILISGFRQKMIQGEEKL